MHIKHFNVMTQKNMMFHIGKIRTQLIFTNVKIFYHNSIHKNALIHTVYNFHKLYCTGYSHFVLQYFKAKLSFNIFQHFSLYGKAT